MVFEPQHAVAFHGNPLGACVGACAVWRRRRGSASAGAWALGVECSFAAHKGDQGMGLCIPVMMEALMAPE